MTEAFLLVVSYGRGELFAKVWRKGYVLEDGQR
jgi:hypothetical protein